MLNITAPALALLEVLLQALFEANRLDGFMARQDGAFGPIADALVAATACAINDGRGDGVFRSEAMDIAKCLYTEAIDNGEDMAYQIQLFNDGRIQV